MKYHLLLRDSEHCASTVLSIRAQRLQKEANAACHKLLTVSLSKRGKCVSNCWGPLTESQLSEHPVFAAPKTASSESRRATLVTVQAEEAKSKSLRRDSPRERKRATTILASMIQRANELHLLVWPAFYNNWPGH